MDPEQYILSLFDQIEDREAELGFSALRPSEQVFYAIWVLEGEVNNGGFDQYFSNSSGEHARDALTALRTIGASSAFDIAQAAFALFGPSGPSTDWETRRRQLESFDEATAMRLLALDRAFQDYPDNISCLLAAYMQQNSA